MDKNFVEQLKDMTLMRLLSIINPIFFREGSIDETFIYFC